MKEFVDSEILSYKVFNPDSDYGHSIGNVLRQSASSTRTSTRKCWRPSYGFCNSRSNKGRRTSSAATGNDLWKRRSGFAQ